MSGEHYEAATALTEFNNTPTFLQIGSDDKGKISEEDNSAKGCDNRHTETETKCKSRKRTKEHFKFPVEPAIVQIIKKKRNYVNHSYRDFSRVPAFDESAANSFSEKVHHILSQEEYAKCISWMPHGRAFRVHIPNAFEKQVLPKYFGHARYSSFLRQLANHGFKHITKGPDRNAYYHEFMLRGLPHLCKYMPKPKKNARRLIPDPDNEPNFYEIMRTHPLPDDEAIMEKNPEKAQVAQAPAAEIGAVVGASNVADPSTNKISLSASMQPVTDKSNVEMSAALIAAYLQNLNQLRTQTTSKEPIVDLSYTTLPLIQNQVQTVDLVANTTQTIAHLVPSANLAPTLHVTPTTALSPPANLTLPMVPQNEMPTTATMVPVAHDITEGANLQHITGQNAPQQTVTLASSAAPVIGMDPSTANPSIQSPIKMTLDYSALATALATTLLQQKWSQLNKQVHK